MRMMSGSVCVCGLVYAGSVRDVNHMHVQHKMRHSELTSCFKEVMCCMLWCGVVWRGVVWCGVVWCGVVWCGVVCGVWVVGCG